MPGWRNQLTQRMPMGSVIKVHAVYEEPFWREEGLSGFAVSDNGPVTVVYDDCPEEGSPGVLVGFIEGEQARIWSRRNQVDRRAGILACLVDLFGVRAGRPRELLERSWADEEYSGGCYTGYFPPGVWPPSARPSASRSAASTGPAPRPPPSGPPSWRAPSAAGSTPPTRSWPPPDRTAVPGGSGPSPVPGRLGPRCARPARWSSPRPHALTWHGGHGSGPMHAPGAVVALGPGRPGSRPTGPGALRTRARACLTPTHPLRSRRTRAPAIGGPNREGSPTAEGERRVVHGPTRTNEPDVQSPSAP
jgi:hypothetical protein